MTEEEKEKKVHELLTELNSLRALSDELFFCDTERMLISEIISLGYRIGWDFDSNAYTVNKEVYNAS